MKLTVALVTFNRPQFLKHSIEAILNQTFKNFEFLILDNGSDQSTFDIINCFKDNRIKYIRNEKNNIEFLNRPFEICSGEYLIITHDDDVMEKTFLEREIAILDKFSFVSLVASNISHINFEGKIIKKKAIRLKKDTQYYKHEFIKSYLLNGNFIAFPTIMMRVSTIKKLNMSYNFNVGPMLDLYFNFQFNLQEKSIYIISDPLYRYRIHDKQDSGINGIIMEFKIIPFIKKMLIDNVNMDLANKYEQSSLSQLIYSMNIKLVSRRLTIKEYFQNIKKIKEQGIKLDMYFLYWFSLGFIKSFGKKIKDIVLLK